MNETYNWYQQLTKPSWAPPSWLFGPAWSVLYTIIVISFGVVFYRVVKGKIPVSVIWPFGLNLIFNLLFTPLQFGLRNNLLAAIDIILVWITIIWGGMAIWPFIRGVVWTNIPYFVWVSFASVLQITITYLNK